MGSAADLIVTPSPADPSFPTDIIDGPEAPAVSLSLDHVHRCPVTSLPVSSPFRARAWHSCLEHFPNRGWADRLVHDIIYGVDIGYRGSRTRSSAPPRNFVDTDEERAAVTKDIEAERLLGHIAGPFTAPPWPHFFSSPLKTVPKKGSTSKFRIIHHLSFPHGNSINWYTLEWPCYLARFDDAIAIVRRLGRGCFMAKVDIKAAYRCVPVRPADWPFLGMYWDGTYYFHTTLPFGLRSSCHLWERYATAAQWCLRNVFGVSDILHYVDDSFIAAATRVDCQDQLDRTYLGMQTLGMPIAEDKTERPCTRLIFLGITIDSIDMSVSLGQDRIASTRALVREWLDGMPRSLRQLQSLIGVLSWAAAVVRHGRTFIQFLRDAEAAHDRCDPDLTTVRLDDDACDDLRWWDNFLDEWNGISLLWETEWLSATDVLAPHTDASGDGFGAYCGRLWLHGRWTAEHRRIAAEDTSQRESMPWKELYAIVVAACTWGHLWSRRRVTFYSDCMPVVQATTKGASRRRRMMQLLRVLHHVAARHSFIYRVIHVPGVDNPIADNLSRVFVYEQLSEATRAAINPSMTTPVLPLIPP